MSKGINEVLIETFIHKKITGYPNQTQPKFTSLLKFKMTNLFFPPRK